MKSYVTPAVGSSQASLHRGAAVSVTRQPWQLFPLCRTPGSAPALHADGALHSLRSLAMFEGSASFSPLPRDQYRMVPACWPPQARRRAAGQPPSRQPRVAAANGAAPGTNSPAAATTPAILNLLQEDTLQVTYDTSDGLPKRLEQQQLYNHGNAASLPPRRPIDASLLQRPTATGTATGISSNIKSSSSRQRPEPRWHPSSDGLASQETRPQQQREEMPGAGIAAHPASTNSSHIPPWPWPRPQAQMPGASSSAAGTKPTLLSRKHVKDPISKSAGRTALTDSDAIGSLTGMNEGMGSGGHMSTETVVGAVKAPGRHADILPRQQTQKDEPAKAPALPLFSDNDPWVKAAYDSLPVTVTGRAPPAPLTSYNDLMSGKRKMPKLLLRNAAAAFRLNRPTPIQGHVIPAMMDGRDVLAVSCTGSGKTLAYLLPVLALLMGRNRMGTKNFAAPEALMLVPTRELAEQLFADVQILLRGSHLKALVVHGGVSMADQVLAIRGRWRRSGGGVDLLIATPGRLLQLVEQRRAVRLSRLGLLVVDEADRMMDLGMWPDLRRLLSQPGLPTARQTVLVAATLPGGQLEAAADELLRDRLAVAVGDGSGTSGVVQQNVELVSDDSKLTRLVELLAPGAATGVAGHGGAVGTTSARAPPQASNPANPSLLPSPGDPALVFTKSLKRAEEVARHLAARGVSVALLHRDLTQDQRDEAMQCFRFGVTSVLVATALASRGLNFPDVAHVINYDVPASSSIYMHQVGRTGRGGRPGLATTLVTQTNRPSAPWLMDSLRLAGSFVPPWLETMAAEAKAKVAALKAAATAKAAKADPDGGARRRLRSAVALDDPSAGATVKFGSYLPPRSSQGRVRSAAAGVATSVIADTPGLHAAQPASGAVGMEAAASLPLQPAVLDRRHDAEYWQAVFDSALQQRHGARVDEDVTAAAAKGQVRDGAAAEAKRRSHQRSSRGARPQREAAAGHDDSMLEAIVAEEADRSVAARRPASAPVTERQRLLFRDTAVELEAHLGGGLTAGPQRGDGPATERRRAQQ